MVGYGNQMERYNVPGPLHQLGTGRADDFVGDDDIPDVLPVAECLGPL